MQRNNAIEQTVGANQSGADSSPETLKVWDIFVRVFHWSLVITFVGAWITADDFSRLHEWAGYSAGGLVLLRIFWGVIGTKYAKFSQFVTSPNRTINYLKSMMRGDEARHVGHNPAGGAMVIALLLGLVGLTISGWMLTLDMFWKVEWVKEGHEAIANMVLVLVLVHIAGVFFAGKRHKENLVRAMITGFKRRAAKGDIE